MNTGRPKGNQKHLDLSARIIIEQHLNNGDSFRSIAIELSKDPSTISKEIRRHSIIRERSADAFAPIPCANNYDSSKPRTNICNVMHMCGDNECRRKCVLCRKFRCSDVCKFYKPRECEKLNKPPYVCNGCSKRTNCMMDKKIYSSKYAQDCCRGHHFSRLCCHTMSHPSTSASSNTSLYRMLSRCNFADRLETLSLQPYSSESRSTTSCIVIPARMICALISLRTFIL